MDIVGEEEADEFPTLRSFVHNHSTWREMLVEYLGVPTKEAKTCLLRIFFHGVPTSDLPLLWALVADVRRASGIILADPRFNYLKGLFSQRRNPVASRLHYAIASIEDSIVQRVQAAIADAQITCKIVTYMFDGVVLMLHPADVPLGKFGIFGMSGGRAENPERKFWGHPRKSRKSQYKN